MPIWLIPAGEALRRFAKSPAGRALLIALAVGIAVLGISRAARHWLAGQRSAAVAADRQQTRAEVATRVTDADRAATLNQAAAAITFANAQQELYDEAHDHGTADPVGPGTRAVLDRMREQQRAGRR